MGNRGKVSKLVTYQNQATALGKHGILLFYVTQHTAPVGSTRLRSRHMESANFAGKDFIGNSNQSQIIMYRKTLTIRMYPRTRYCRKSHIYDFPISCSVRGIRSITDRDGNGKKTEYQRGNHTWGNNHNASQCGNERLAKLTA